MKAISLLQPFASLIVIGAKKFETRSWGTRYRGPLLIHASKKWDTDQEQLLDTFHFGTALQNTDGKIKLPFGSVIGKVYLASVNYTQVVVGSLSEQEKAFGDYTHGRYAWELKDPVQFDKPIPYKGSLSIWEFPDELLLKAK
ncbi:MAG: hypothetical protein JWO92_2531 [Chitinophagaceae bacterium]|nr:hypothetical protein [Chitinophagaceae bacterium]